MATPMKPFVHGGSYYPSRVWTPFVRGNGWTTQDGGEEQGVPKTVSGSLLHITDALAGDVKALSVAIEPVQDLNGYDNPWPAGGGKNKFNIDTITIQTLYSMTVTKNGNVVKVDGTATSSGRGTLVIFYFAETGTYRLHVTGDFTWLKGWTEVGKNVTVTVDDTSVAYRLATASLTSGTEYHLTASEIQVESGSSYTGYAPYSNICPISGWSSAKVWRTGKNLLDDVNPDVKNAYITGSQKLGSSPDNRTVIVPIKQNTNYTYTWNRVKIEGAATDDTNILLFSEYPVVGTTVGTSTGSIMTNVPSTRTFNSGDNIYAAIKIANITKTEYQATLSASQLEIGSPASDYEAYTGTTLTIDLDGTIYGGTLDVLTGVLTVDRRYTTIGAENVTKVTNSNYANFQLSFGASDKPKADQANAVCISSAFKGYSFNDAPADDDNYAFANNNGAIRVKNTANAGLTSNEWKTLMADVQLCYLLATPTTVQLDPAQLSTLAGENNVWADTGDTTMTYMAQGE